MELAGCTQEGAAGSKPCGGQWSLAHPNAPLACVVLNLGRTSSCWRACAAPLSTGPDSKSQHTAKIKCSLIASIITLEVPKIEKGSSIQVQQQ